MTRHAMVVQHDDADGPGAIARALDERGIALRVVRGYAGEPIPASIGDACALVVMGGPMAADDDAAHPFLAGERRLIRAAVESGAPTLAVCLGAQLLAVAMGGRVERGAAREIGWHEVERTAGSGDDAWFDLLPPRFTPFHWHEDAIVAPADATRLARSAVAPVQAFRVGRRAHGLQFHIELDAPAIRDWCADPAHAAHARDDARIAEQERLARALFGAWADRL